MRRHAMLALATLLLQQAAALHTPGLLRAPLCSARWRTSAPPLLLAKRKRGSRGGSEPEPPPPREAAPDEAEGVPALPTPLMVPPDADAFAAAGPPAAAAPPPPPWPSVDDDSLLVGQIRDEPKMALPSFDSYSRGASKPPPPSSGQYESKLPSVNPGTPYQAPEKEEKPLFERVVFAGTWAGILLLVVVEIVINSGVLGNFK